MSAQAATVAREAAALPKPPQLSIALGDGGMHCRYSPRSLGAGLGIGAFGRRWHQNGVQAAHGIADSMWDASGMQ